MAVINGYDRKCHVAAEGLATLQRYAGPTVVSSTFETSLLPPSPPIGTKSSWRSKMTPVYDQQSMSACAPFAVLSGVDHLLTLKGDDPIKLAIEEQDFGEAVAMTPGFQNSLSASNLIDAASKKFGKCADLNLSIIECVEIVRDEGIVREPVWPFDPTKICWTNPPQGAQGLRFGCKDATLLYWVDQDGFDQATLGNTNALAGGYVRVDLIRSGLTIGPVIIDIAVWQIPNVAGWLGGDVRVPAPYPEDPPDWHAIVIVSYDDTTRLFEFKNSWGRLWGNNGGYGRLPYDYVARFSRVGIVVR